MIGPGDRHLPDVRDRRIIHDDDDDGDLDLPALRDESAFFVHDEDQEDEERRL
jgi:hypothetical protein